MAKAKVVYSSGIGVSEAVSRTLNKAKTIIGTVDEKGDNIGIVDIQLRAFHKLPMIMMLVFFVPVLLGYFFQTPFDWIPIDSVPGSTWDSVKNWQMFTVWGWLFAVLAYSFLTFCVLLKNNLYSGVEGAFILFQCHGEIVKILSPGELWINFDWRITPDYVVSSKKFMLSMPQVEGKEKSNHTIYHSGAFVAQIANSQHAHALISKGGFKNLVKALTAVYVTSVKDLFKTTTADSFNTFLIEPIAGATGLKDDSRELDQISKQNLSTELIEKLARIDNVDVSAIDLSESEDVRNIILPMLANVAAEYGITLEDYVPLGNNVHVDFLGTKVIKLVTILERLKQASDNLFEIISEEWDEDIQSAVAGKKVGALEIKKIIDEMQALMVMMLDESNINKIFEQKSQAIGNIMQGHIGSILAAIETLQNKITSKTVDMTGLELYVAELENFIKSLDSKEAIEKLAPAIESAWISNANDKSLLPSVDAIEKMLDITGMDKILAKLRGGLETENSPKKQTFEVIQNEINEIREEAEKIDTEKVLSELQKRMDTVEGNSGMDMTAFRWDNVRKRISGIKEDAGVEDEENVDVENAEKVISE